MTILERLRELRIQTIGAANDHALTVRQGERDYLIGQLLPLATADAEHLRRAEFERDKAGRDYWEVEGAREADAERMAELERLLTEASGWLREWPPYSMNLVPARALCGRIDAALHPTSPPPGQHGAEAETQPGPGVFEVQRLYEEIAAGQAAPPPVPGHGGSIPPGWAPATYSFRLVCAVCGYADGNLPETCPGPARAAPEAEQRAGVELDGSGEGMFGKEDYAMGELDPRYDKIAPAPAYPPTRPVRAVAGNVTTNLPSPTPGEPRTVPGDGEKT